LNQNGCDKNPAEKTHKNVFFIIDFIEVTLVVNNHVFLCHFSVSILHNEAIAGRSL
jgi:hypothetical protein